MSGITPIKDFAGFSLNTQMTDQQFEKLPKKKEYNDPLMKWPVRGMAFTNDIGAAIMDIAPKAGMMFWVPALMYFGADIYDKYRNDKDSYDPSAKRGMKQAAFQAFASILFPIAAVHLGQKTASIAGKMGKTGLSLQTREEIIEHHAEYMSNYKLRHQAPDVYKKQYAEALDNYIDETMRQRQTKNPFKIVMNAIFGGKHRDNLSSANQRPKIHEFITERIDKMFETRQQLIDGKKPTGISEKMFEKFQTLKAEYKKTPAHAHDYTEKAAKDIVKAIEKNKIFKIKFAKTIGGFVALGALIQPIDKFVEHVIIEKFVDPSLKHFDGEQIKQFKQRNLKT
ncbi:MAG: hypothetical protein E7Z93_00920 [Cyanobacteria bacterium SIG32]|nr:hypothetical protein [Cyanobacteria bacterium SIG32]